MKRILILNYEFPPLGGGAANATYYLLKEFAKDPELTIDLVTSSVDAARVEAFAPNITIHYLDIGKRGNVHYQSNAELLSYSYYAYRYAKKLTRSKQFDLVHAFFGIPCGYIAMRLGLPYIVSLRGSDVPFYNPRFAKLDRLVFQRLSRRIWKRAHSVIANSAELKALALSSAPEQEIGVIYNGVDTEEFKPNAAAADPAPLTLTSTGRLIERKGYRYLIDALEGMPNVRLVLVGEGNMRDELIAHAKVRGVDMVSLGSTPHDEIVSLLQSADVFVLPSLNEGMSNSILEAMACGLPIVTTDTGGSRELVTDNGIVVPKADSAALRAALTRLQGDPAERTKMAAASRQHALALSWANVAKEYKTIYGSNS